MAYEHGSARFLTKDEAMAAGLIGTAPDGLTLGYMWHGEEDAPIFDPVIYRGEQHVMTSASNRTGKGTSAIIPNLLTYRGSVLVIDVKGENAIVTADTRRRMGQNVQIIDPWRVALSRLQEECGFDGSDPDHPPFDPAAFNPLDMIDPDSPDLSDDLMMIADAMIVAEGGEASHWSTEAGAALAGFTGHVITSPEEEGKRNLGRVREILSMPPVDLQDLIVRMAESPVQVVAGAANRLMQKSERELQSVISTATANTHWLDSRSVQEALTRSTFDFADLKSDDRPLTVYIVLPADRLNTHGRWLRLLVSMALTAVARRKGKPKIPALFILDEFAALGRLAMVEQAVGLMAGFGLKIWAILQDLSQLQDLYQRRWQTFIANAGAVQVFGTGDMNTADYVSRMMGKQTLEIISENTAAAREGWFWQFPNYRGIDDKTFARDLLMPEEILKLPAYSELVMISGYHPIMCEKLPYFTNSRFFDWNAEGDFVPTYTEHPDQPKYEQTNGTIEADEETRERIKQKFAEWGADVPNNRPKRKKKRWGIF